MARRKSVNMPKSLGSEDLAELLKNFRQNLSENPDAHSQLKQCLVNPDTKNELIVSILQELEKDVTSMNKDQEALIKIIMNLNWLSRGQELISAYQAFMMNLASAQPFHLKACLKMLVKKFIPENLKYATLEEYKACQSKLEEEFSHVHYLLLNVCKLAPISVMLLTPILEGCMPYITKGPVALGSYAHNILMVTKYLPSLRRDILDMVMKQMIQLDVRFSKQDVSSVLDTDDAEEEAIFKMEEDGEKQDADDPVKKLSPEERVFSHLPVASSLDAMMTIIFAFIKDTCHPKDKLDWEATKQLYRELLSSFDTYIFTSNGINHVQFVMFYICSFKEPLSDGFIDYLWKKVTNPNSQSLYRKMAACYLGSFLTRASYISIGTAKEVMSLMVKWIHNYLDQSCDQNTDVVHYGPFYSVCQACFYIFCFKHNAFFQTHKGHKWAEALNFQRIITSKQNPLKECLQIIVKTFASLARTYQLAFCDTIIERNNRYYLPTSSSGVIDKLVPPVNLEFFPFDPYFLPGSSVNITSLYMEFHGHVQIDEEDDSEEEDDFLPDEDEMLSTKNAACMSLGKSPIDFFQHGVSPGFQHF